MDKKLGDLRMLIVPRMIHNGMHSSPLTENEAFKCMFEIAVGMKGLHRKGTTLRDPKAANVLLSRPGSPWKNPHLLDPVSGGFRCEVADYECSVGTKFWRVPEILLALKNTNITPGLFTTASAKNENITLELFTKALDTYSYGMTCYEIITGRIHLKLKGSKPPSMME